MRESDIEAKVDALIGAMTTEEKVHQLQSFYLNGNARLGIPNLQPCECLHGVLEEHATSFPQAIAMASTWDTDLVRRVAATIAQEARAFGVHQTYSPMLGVARDPRWCRTEECFSEDPYLVSRMGVATILGFQGEGDERFGPDRIIATAKHFVADGEPLGGLNGSPAELSDRVLHEVHLAPFKAAVEEARVGSIMPAHHTVNGIPCHTHKALLQDLLRETYGFDGFVVADNNDIKNLITCLNAAETPVEAARMSLEAGVDQEMNLYEVWNENRMYGESLIAAVASGEIDERLVDEAARNVLRAKLRLGLLEEYPEVDPARDPIQNPEREIETYSIETYAAVKKVKGIKRPNLKDVIYDEANDALALEAAEKAVILLKNEAGRLPLDKDGLKTIAVLGPNSQARRLGRYSTGDCRGYVSVLDGIRAAVGKGTEVVAEEGCRIEDPAYDKIEEAAALARKADVAVLVLGGSHQTAVENVDRDTLQPVGLQNELAQAVMDTGTPVVLVLLHGRPLAITRIAEQVDAVLDGWYLGQACGTALARVLFGEVNPSGKLTVTIPRNVGQVPCYYNRMRWGRNRTYLDSTVEPLFPFGFGLSYTTFAYAEPRLAQPEIARDARTSVGVEVTNTGDRAGDEIVQMYVRDLYVSRNRPILELKGFRRIALEPGETKTVSLDVTPEKLAFWEDGAWVVEPGAFDVLVGPSSVDLQAARLEVV